VISISSRGVSWDVDDVEPVNFPIRVGLRQQPVQDDQKRKVCFHPG
jgi:hypothetical protein